MKAFVVIPNWNGAELVASCLASLQQQTQEHTIVVVDNGSSDDSVKVISSQFPGVIVLQNERNLGFAGGVNTGLRYALQNGADYIALFNNDAVADKNWLKYLIKTAGQQPRAGIITSKLLRIDKKTIDSTGEQYSTWGTPFARGRGELDTGQYDRPETVLAASGGASLYRTAMLREIGLFDERFFAYYEDDDISLRARLAGWEVWYEPEAVAYHHVGATSSKLGDFTLYHQYKNFVFLALKNLPWELLLKHGWKILGVFIFKLLLLLRKLKLALFIKLIAIVIWQLSGILYSRWQIQSKRQIKPVELDKLLYHAPPPTQPGLARWLEKHRRS